MDQQKIIMFLVYWIANSVLLIIFSMVLAGQIVLGNAMLAMPMAAVLAGLILTAAGYGVEPAMKKAAVKTKDEKVLAIAYLVVNVLVLWVVKKLAFVTGLGISNNLYVVIVAVAATLVQWGVFKYVGKYVSKSK